jgi:hypothetical protein
LLPSIQGLKDQGGIAKSELLIYDKKKKNHIKTKKSNIISLENNMVDFMSQLSYLIRI